ncbi:MAG: hypothetical protein CMG60_08120 [Candidatus Marinimicrobia bacterium]|nr:hypothetical protein [Candidatus Neomarinimicrobiota bacterium]
MFYSTLYRLNNRTFYDVFEDEVMAIPLDIDPILPPSTITSTNIEPDEEFTPYIVEDTENIVENKIHFVIALWLMILYLRLLYMWCRRGSLMLFPNYYDSLINDNNSCNNEDYDGDDESNDYFHTALDEQLEIITDQQELVQRYVGKVKKLEKKIKKMKKQLKTLKESKIKMDVIEKFIENFKFGDYTVND